MSDKSFERPATGQLHVPYVEWTLITHTKPFAINGDLHMITSPLANDVRLPSGLEERCRRFKQLCLANTS